MNCGAFEKRLERYRTGKLCDAERREMDQHLCRCIACRALLEAIQTGENHVAQVDLSEAVLAQTTGSACGRCRSLLGDVLDGVSDTVEKELVIAHLASCASCSSLFRIMSEAAEILPRMREMIPDPSFVPDVLNAVRPLWRDRLGLSKALEWLRGLTQRPRFSWEAAYLGTLLVFGLFGTPFSPVPDAGSRLLASLQNREGLIAETDSSIHRWYDEAETLIAASARARQEVSRISARSLEAADVLVDEGRACIRHSTDYVSSTRKTVQSRIADVYQQTKRSKAAKH